MAKLSKKKFLIVSLMLFSMFFGAGNFIFPPMVGKDAGVDVYSAILFFCLTAVALPVLGIAAVAKSGSMDNLVKRVDPYFAMIFTVLIYIVIGPSFAIPRAANMPFEVSIAPLLPQNWNSYALAIYSAIYFIINYLICINPSRMVVLLGKILTPLMLILILVLFVGNLVAPIGEFAPSVGSYAKHPISQGFVDGYQTMDALASIVFAIVVINAMKKDGVKSNQAIVISTIRTGILAGVILMAIYMMLAYLGASASATFSDAKNGAELLSKITQNLYGNLGMLLLGAIFLLACLTTTIGLVSSASEFFSTLVKGTSYKFWAILWSVISFCVANVGLNALLAYSIPVLVAIYPITIMLIILGLIDNFILSSKIIYRPCIYLVCVIGVINGLDVGGLKVPFLTEFISQMPFYDIQLGWVIPEIVCFIVTYIVFILRQR